MVNPINYTLGGPDPVGQLMQGIQFGTGLRQAGLQEDAQRQQMELAAAQEARTAEMQPLRMEQAQLGLDASRQGLQQGQLTIEQQRRQLAAADRQLARQEAFQSSMTRLAELGPSATFEDYQKVGAAFPEFAGAVQESWTGLDSNRQAGVQRRLLQIGAALKGGATDTAVQLAEEYADAAENSGDAASAATARAIAELARTNPNAALASLGLTISAIDPDGGANLFGPGSVHSSTQVGNGRIDVQTMKDGSVRVIDTATNEVLTGEAARLAILEAEQAGAEAQAARAGAREGATLGARAQGAERAKAAESLGGLRGGIVADAGKSISNVTSTLRNYDRAIRAIDEGGNTGFFYNRLPNITQESAELKNALDSLGLDVIGSVTFGALSEGELALAMDTAAPRNLGPEALREWLVERREAQRKVRESLLEMQSFLSDPNNTLNDWYELVRQADQDMFLEEMQAKRGRGDPFTDEELARIQQIAGGQ